MSEVEHANQRPPTIQKNKKTTAAAAAAGRPFETRGVPSAASSKTQETAVSVTLADDRVGHGWVRSGGEKRKHPV